MSSEAVQRVLGSFAECEALLPGADDARVRSWRRGAIERFGRSGYPSTRHEAWRYTNVGALAARAFVPRLATPDVTDPTLASSRATLALEVDVELVCVDGVLRPELSRLPAASTGITVQELGATLAEHLERLGAPDAEGFDALRQAFLGGGVHLRVARSPSGTTPVVHCLHLVADTATPVAVNHALLVDLDADAALVLIETFATPGRADCLINSATRLKLGRGARLEHCRLDVAAAGSFQVARLDAELDAGAELDDHAFALGAGFLRHDLDVAMAGEHAAAALNGLYLAAGRRHVDHHTCIEHRVARARSAEHYRGVLSGRGRAVFNGRVVVRPGADGTDAEQSNHNLLLSPDAEVDTKPELEIYADDVRCSHGATVGQLDAQALFYLQSRGIAREDAEALLIGAFARQAVARITTEPVRRAVGLALTRHPLMQLVVAEE